MAQEGLRRTTPWHREAGQHLGAVGKQSVGGRAALRDAQRVLHRSAGDARGGGLGQERGHLLGTAEAVLVVGPQQVSCVLQGDVMADAG